MINTPGLSWRPVEDASSEDFAQTRTRDILLRNRRSIQRLKDSSPVRKYSGRFVRADCSQSTLSLLRSTLLRVAEPVSRATREDLMLLYNLLIFTDGDANTFLPGSPA